MKYVVDRIENNICVIQNLETGEIINIEKTLLPSDVKEKDVLIKNNDEYELDSKEKEDRIELIRKKMEKLREK